MTPGRIGTPASGRAALTDRLSRPRDRLLVVLALLVAVWALLSTASTPSLAVSMYGLAPIVLSGYWFELRGALLAAAATTLMFLGDKTLDPPPELAGATLWLATLNRALVFFGVGVLVTLLLRRERALVLRLRSQEEELAELESLRAVLTPGEVPDRPHLRIATAFTPAEGLAAGDFFLVVDGPDDSTTVVVGDVVGHGLEAARCAAFVRAALSTFAHFSTDPVQLLQLANTALAQHPTAETRFVTVVCLNIAPPPERTVRWAAAGHEVPWELDSASPLPGGRVGAPLGIGTAPLSIGAGTCTLSEGQGILAFTDGLVEGRSAHRVPSRPLEQFGEERARQLVREHRGADPAVVLDALVSAVATFTGGAPADDLCLVAFRAEPVGVPAGAPAG